MAAAHCLGCTTTSFFILSPKNRKKSILSENTHSLPSKLKKISISGEDDEYLERSVL